MFSVDDPLDFVRLGRRDSKHAYRSSSCSRPCGPITLEPSGCHSHPPASELQKNGPMNDTSHALLSPRCEQLLARLFVAQIRENDVSSLRKLPDQIKVLTEERLHCFGSPGRLSQQLRFGARKRFNLSFDTQPAIDDYERPADWSGCV